MLMRAVSIAALLAVPVPTAPQAIPTPKWSDATPPARFRAYGLVPVLYLPSALIGEACSSVGNPPDGMHIIACTLVTESGQPFVVMPDPCERAELEWHAQVQCHENAHALRGWKHETE